ncbi:MAG: universal stress protein [Gelidibacter sp.]|nr:universal stress protein [Gelidibacter sp.]
MKNILLPTDFSENSWNAIKYALAFFEASACNFYLLHVNKLNNLALSDSPYIASQQNIEDIYTKPVKKQLQDAVKRIREELPNTTHHKFYTLTDFNFFVESIRDNVDEKAIDMIVMGTKGASGVKKLIVGSNTGDVIRKVQCTTLVVPENASFKELKEIAFPTDFSLHYSVDTLQPILDVISSYKSSLRILHISKKKTDLNTDQKKNKDLLEDYFSNTDHSFHFLTNKKVEDAVQCFVESRNIDMITMVAKNLNYFQQILFHNKVEEISYHTDVPFLVLHK